jgi:folate-dependent phosphoribosylglycinamide formyltransferase PurN
MRIVFLAVDDAFAGRMQQYVYESHPEWVVGSVISTRAIYKKSKIGATLFVLRRSGLRYGMEMFRMKVMRKMAGSDVQTRPSEFAKRHGVERYYSENINDAESLRQLERWSPDIVISTNFSHFVGARARKVARISTWNLHKSYLPYYRGMAPSFYALLDQATEVGATLHVISEGFDTGDIIRQVRVPVTSSDTVYSLNQNTSDAGGRMLAELLERENPAQIVPTPQPAGDWPNHTYPTRQQVKTFLDRGLRF